jgi:hypothetical protein
MTTSPPPRRKWNITRWLFVFALVALAWSGWRAYVFRSALAEAKALEWYVEYTDPVETIRADWKTAFMKDTWLNGVTFISFPYSELLERNLGILHRLNPKELKIHDAQALRDLSALNGLTRLEGFSVDDGTNLTDVDVLKNLSTLKKVEFPECAALTNVDSLNHLLALERISAARG